MKGGGGEGRGIKLLRSLVGDQVDFIVIKPHSNTLQHLPPQALNNDWYLTIFIYLLRLFCFRMFFACFHFQQKANHDGFT